jgi:hypothetical protein
MPIYKTGVLYTNDITCLFPTLHLLNCAVKEDIWRIKIVYLSKIIEIKKNIEIA